MGVHFVSVSEICDLHDQFFQDPTPTDCITLPVDDLSDDPETYCMLGDVFVCPKVAIEYASANGEDFYRETTLYVVHGILHLMGYDDMDEKECVRMRAAEERHMKNLVKLGLLLRSE